MRHWSRKKCVLIAGVWVSVVQIQVHIFFSTWVAHSRKNSLHLSFEISKIFTCYFLKIRKKFPILFFMNFFFLRVLFKIFFCLWNICKKYFYFFSSTSGVMTFILRTVCVWHHRPSIKFALASENVFYFWVLTGPNLIF